MNVSNTTFILWHGGQAFLSASNVAITFEDGLVYQFQDDQDRPLRLNWGGQGEEISREDDWVEDGRERRLKFYFGPTSQFFGEGQAEPDYWDVYESRLYDRTEEWIYANLEMGSMSAPRQTLFHCDEVVFQYVPYPEIAEGSRSNAQMTAQDFFVGGYLTAGYDPCDMNVFNPCRTRWDQFNETEETPYCSAYNGIVSCSVRPIETVVTAQARSVQALDSRQCSGPQSGSGAEDNGSSLQEQNQNINANASANDSTAESDNGVTEDEAESNEDDTTNDSTSQGACLAYRSFWMAMLLMVLIFC